MIFFVFIIMTCVSARSCGVYSASEYVLFNFFLFLSLYFYFYFIFFHFSLLLFYMYYMYYMWLLGRVKKGEESYLKKALARPWSHDVLFNKRALSNFFQLKTRLVVNFSLFDTGFPDCIRDTDQLCTKK